MQKPIIPNMGDANISILIILSFDYFLLYGTFGFS